MTKHKITMTLSQSSIQNAIKEIEKYKNSLEYKSRILAEKLAQKGVEIARVQIASLDAIFTGELIESVHSEYKSSIKGGAIFAVVADSTHAAFVEFGTGMIGSKTPYPKLPDGVSWQYASGKTIHQLVDGRYGWFYQIDGQWYFTEGMPSRPFMYNTSLELMRQVVKTAKEVFSG
jgi:hypothetical protein